MDTRKLYYENAYTQDFRSRVLSCERTEKGWATVLDATAFFPEEGGQSADTGTLAGVRVLDAHEKNGVITHLTEGPLSVGQMVKGHVNWPERFRKMQTHTAEHILSGLAHKSWGYDNVGFHLGESGCTLDLSGELDREQVRRLEQEANRVVWADKRVLARFPRWPELATLEYRSKLDLTENVRIVTVEGVDACACCAPHVSRTGQIGVIKIVDFMRHRGGMRLWMKAGSDALEDYCRRHEDARGVGSLLNVPREEIVQGAEKLLEQRDALKRELGELRRRALQERAAALEETEGDMLLFAQADEEGMRLLANAGMEKCSGVCAVFSGQDGAWRFVMASRSRDMRAYIKENGPALRARGGGQERMVSGRSAASQAELEAFFKK